MMTETSIKPQKKIPKAQNLDSEDNPKNFKTKGKRQRSFCGLG